MAQMRCHFQKNDEYLTPAYAVYPIIKRIKAGSAVWCPFDMADSPFVRILTEYGFSVTYGHIPDRPGFFYCSCAGL